MTNNVLESVHKKLMKKMVNAILAKKIVSLVMKKIASNVTIIIQFSIINVFLNALLDTSKIEINAKLVCNLTVVNVIKNNVKNALRDIICIKINVLKHVLKILSYSKDPAYHVLKDVKTVLTIRLV